MNKNQKKNNPFLIAEIGKNFIQTKEEQSVEEYLTNAKNLIKEAKNAGADAVKFQTHNVEDEQLNIKVTSPHFKGSDRHAWVKRNTDNTPIEFWQELKKYCDELNITFFSTPMSRGAAQKINGLVELWKVGSGDLLDFVLLDYIASTKKPIILSAGMSTLAEIDKAINFLKKKTKDIALLYCVSQYPCEPKDLNLKTIQFFKDRYNIPIGFSDHSLGYKSSLAAVQLGATIIEKHFSLNRNLWGADHKFSLTPPEFQKMVELMKQKAEVNLADYNQKIEILNQKEKEFRGLFRKNLVASQAIPKGTIIKPEMIYAMRPQKYIKGLPSEEYPNILDKKINKNLKKYAPITSNILI